MLAWIIGGLVILGLLVVFAGVVGYYMLKALAETTPWCR